MPCSTQIPFDEVYTNAGEDRDWCLRVEQAGYALTPVPGARAHHWHELTARSFVKKHTGYGRASALFRARTGGSKVAAGFYPRAIERGFRMGVRIGLLVVAGLVLSLLGALHYAAISSR